MFVAKYPDFLARVTFKDGSQRYFDGVKDLMKYYLNLPKYEPGKGTEEMAAILVTDYYSLKPLDAFQAYYVVGSDVYGPMGKELIPLGSEPEAREFLKDHKGQAVLRFREISGDLLKSLD
jgi:nitrous oxide reductase accessory protein NosL